MDGESTSGDLVQATGASIARWRKRAGFTQARAGDELGLEKETISRIETGTIVPTLHRLGQFARLYGCPVAAFFMQADEPTAADSIRLAALLEGVDVECRSRILRVAEEIAEQCRRSQQLENALAERALLEAALPPGSRRRRQTKFP
ncbi:MAG: helix-turn-helix transcriptional regulator [Burkholderia gladioli]